MGQGPRLLAVNAPGEGTVGRDAVVALSFDRPVDLGSLAGAVSFQPEIAFEVAGEAECLVVPVNLLEGEREYVFRLQAGAVRDRAGRPSEDGTALAFAVRDGSVTLEVPALGFEGNVQEAQDADALLGVLGSGAGHYPRAGRPGRSNFVLLAHASGRIDFPFNGLAGLKTGDRLNVRCEGKAYEYVWESGLVVAETETWILDPSSSPVLTIFVCCGPDGKPSPTFHPPYRYVVRAALAADTLPFPPGPLWPVTDAASVPGR